MVDFNRNVYCVLGLPFDAITQCEAAQQMEQSRDAKKRCFMSTPNLNFAILSRDNGAFRDSVCRSDLSVADGMPLVWLARLLGTPVSERVSGSGLFEFLRSTSRVKWNVFFFGGPQGGGQLASLALGSLSSRMRPVGYLFPGYVDVEQMSRPDLIECINSSGADMLVVSLGSAKGQAWISQNLSQLRVPVVSGLGAVINFVAGTVRRAPRWMQKSGLEWLWRIKEEPTLWRRYLKDGLALAGIVLGRVLPLFLYRLFSSRNEAETTKAKILFPFGPNVGFVKLGGVWNERCLSGLRDTFKRAVTLDRDVTLDLSATKDIDSAFIGLLLLLDTALRDRGRTLTLKQPSARVRVLLKLHCVDHMVFA